MYQVNKDEVLSMSAIRASVGALVASSLVVLVLAVPASNAYAGEGFEPDWGGADFSGFDSGSYSYDTFTPDAPADNTYSYDTFTPDWNDSTYSYDTFTPDQTDTYSYDTFTPDRTYYDSDCGCQRSSGSGSGQSFSGGGFRGFSGGGFTIMPPTTISQPPTYYPPQQQPPHYTNTNTNTNTNINTNTCTNNSCNNTSTVTNVNNTPQQPYYPVVYQQQPAPYCTITINNGYYGQNVSLTWTSQNASSAYISGIGNVSTYGSRTVYGNGGTAYTMTVTGAGGSANCQTQAIYYPTPVPTPVPQPIPSNLYCQIYATNGSIQNGQAAYLSWSSTGATYASLNDGIGSVAPNGTLAVRPESSRNYVLTVYGYGGSRTCSTSVTVNGTSVSLTQIPYTGFDFGATGNAIYWASLLAFAASLAYLALYFQGGALAIAGNAFRRNSAVRVNVNKSVETIKVAPAKQAVINLPAAHVQAPVIKKEVVAPFAAAEFKTADKMNMVRVEGQAPRLVISRA